MMKLIFKEGVCTLGVSCSMHVKMTIYPFEGVQTPKSAAK